MAASAQPLADYESSELAPEEDAPCRWWNAAVPGVVVVFSTLYGLFHTGRASLRAAGDTTRSLSRIIGASDPFTVLLWASLLGLAAAILLAVVQGILSIGEVDLTISGQLTDGAMFEGTGVIRVIDKGGRK